ncbi:hypothetical protein F383_25570 [Gossypium arboreum]|uniref:Uncharacterized protein n=1 Tax=Gossypium arboreum TaxID=29729 RepID=A0A0B0MVL8_GOSAR|nr:hypothetical protein F383_25570 [Gossypium arboreum]
MVLHINLKSMPTSQTWSYTKSHIVILCHDICTIPIVRTRFFGRPIHHYSLRYKQ